jgi:hypothetical protein
MKYLAALSISALLLLAACGGTTEERVDDPSPIAGGPGSAMVIAPLILDAVTPTGVIAVGRSVVFALESPADWVIAVDHPELASVSQGSDDGSAVYNPGFTATGAGTVVATLTNSASGAVAVYTVEITQ